MPYPRSHLVDATSSGIYHVQSRCVRRSWLCGLDRETGRDFTHRRAWIERRILQLAEYFSVSIYAYAVMSDHYHIVLETHPEDSLLWDDEEVVDRWLAVCPGRESLRRDPAAAALRRSALLADAEHVAVLRDRLSSLSWFMRFLNEPLARMANLEDGCTGRFWQGRFASQRLLDEAAVLAALVYVDLNPVRAGIADDESQCTFTSIHHRLSRQGGGDLLRPLNWGVPDLSISPITLADYRSLLRWTAQAQRGQRRAGRMSHPCLERRQIDIDQWEAHCLPRPGQWRRASGSLQSLREYAAALGQRWIQVKRYAPAH